MAEGNRFNHVPKKFTRGHSEPTQINKFNYTGGCWNKAVPYNSTCAIDPDTGGTAHPINTSGHVNYGTYYSGWIYYIPYRLPNGVTGKRFDVDFAYFAGPSYYDFLNINMWLDVAFYSESSRQWTGYHRLGGPFHIQDNISYTELMYRGSAGNYRPRCGLACQPGSLPVRFNGAGDPTTSGGAALSSYSAFHNYLQSCGIPIPHWDGRNYHYIAAASHGVRYMSSNGQWSNGNSIITSAAACVYGHWRYSNPSSRTSSSLDGGSNLSTGMLSFYITEDFIRACCGGSSSSISKFKLRFWRGDNSPSIYWDWPGNELPQWQALDNPKVGLLDWGAKNSPQDWPPRYDARAWYRNKTANIQQPELMVRYCPRNSSNWQIN